MLPVPPQVLRLADERRNYGTPLRHTQASTHTARVALFALAALVSSVGLMGWSPPAQADAALAAQRNCLGCHHAVQRRNGPSFQAIAKRYNAIEDPKMRAFAVAALERKMRHGGRGAWGVVPMPSNPQVTEADAKKLVAWILESHK